MADKARAARRRSASEWQALVAEAAESGEDVGSFCRRRGLKKQTLQWWRWRLHASVRAGEPAATRRRPVGVGRFAEFELGRMASPPAPGGSFELRWPDGLTLAIPREFDESALRRLLLALETNEC
jgi:hypothetical protein